MNKESILDPNEKGSIAIGSYHPSADMAMQYIKSIPVDELMMFQESFASTALAGNEFSEILGETLRRLLSSETVSDRYLLGLAWAIRDMKESESN